MDRFDGKELVNRPVSDGIRKPEELINLALSGTAPVYHGQGKDTGSDEGNAEGTVGQRIYKDLMNGVSHMLPFVIGGGIAIALSFMVDQFMVYHKISLQTLGIIIKLPAGSTKSVKLLLVSCYQFLLDLLLQVSGIALV